jgi:glycosyltransferase involved in cell wall biosynthesis
MGNQSRRRVLFALSKFHKGGAEKNIHFLISKLCEEDFDVILVVFNADNIGYDLPSRVRLVNLRSSLIGGVFKFVKYIYESKPDVVFSTVSYFNIYVAILRYFFPPKIIFIAREANILSMLNRDEGFIKGYLFGTLVARVFYKRGFDIYIAQTEKMKEDMITHFGIPHSRVFTVGNPIYSEAFLKFNLDKSYTKEKRVYRFVTVGRLHAQKGIDRILESLSKIDEDFILDIYGLGPLESKLKFKCIELRIDDKVSFKGFELNVIDVLPNYDLFLLGSYYEGFPNVVLECGLVGLPVYSFYCSGCLEGILLDGINGFVEKSDSIDKYSQRLIKVSNYNWDIIRIRELIDSKFSGEVIFNKYKQIFNG